MKKKIIFLIILCLTFATGVFAAGLQREYIAKETAYNIEINGVQQSFTLPIVSIVESTYVALRQLCEKLGYRIEWNGEDGRINLFSENKTQLPYFEDMSKSQEGVLSNGKNYNYIASEAFSYQKQAKQWGLIEAKGNYGEVPTAKMAAEIGQTILGYNSDASSDITIQVFFDKENDVWFVTGLNKGTSHAGLRVVVIGRTDGKIITKYELR